MRLGLEFNGTLYDKLFSTVNPSHPYHIRYWLHEDVNQALIDYAARGFGIIDRGTILAAFKKADLSYQLGQLKEQPPARWIHLGVYSLGWRYTHAIASENGQVLLQLPALITPGPTALPELVRRIFGTTILNALHYGTRTWLKLNMKEDTSLQYFIVGLEILENNYKSFPSLNADYRMGLDFLYAVKKHTRSIQEAITRVFRLINMPFHEFLQQATEEELIAYKKAANKLILGTRTDPPDDSVVFAVV